MTAPTCILYGFSDNLAKDSWSAWSEPKDLDKKECFLASSVVDNVSTRTKIGGLAKNSNMMRMT